MKLIERAFARLYANRLKTLAGGLGLIAIIALIDYSILPNVSLGFLYIIPIVVLASVLRTWQILLIAALCTLFREVFSPFAFESQVLPRLLTVFGAFSAAGILTAQVHLNQRLLVREARLREEYLVAQQEAAEQLRVLVDTSPLAVLIAGGDGKLVLANESARRLFGFDADYRAEEIGHYLPSLDRRLTEQAAVAGLRTEFECQANGKDGHSFLAHVWLSCSRTGAGSRVQAVVWDASEELTEREEGAVKSLNRAARGLVSALGHEVRNLAGAARKVHECLSAQANPGNRGELDAMGNILCALERLGASEMRFDNRFQRSVVDLETVLQQARVLVARQISGSDIALEWTVPDELPQVFGECYALMQVFLNLVNNSQEALRNSPRPQIRVTVEPDGARILVRISDSGPGIAHPEELFQPFRAFRSSKQGAGLGLYISRTIVRSFGGDLSYEPSPAGACFVVELGVAASLAAPASHGS